MCVFKSLYKKNKRRWKHSLKGYKPQNKRLWLDSASRKLRSSCPECSDVAIGPREGQGDLCSMDQSIPNLSQKRVSLENGRGELVKSWGP